ncbi:hypothetical protein U9M48_028037 [Paspalum notatum var. saurae]|uniref:Uncharacterized protein n=1 Tax=Paspalum notatum var. saurae TaxID=547442 RepID=A0AAQ3X0M8_PASNO
MRIHDRAVLDPLYEWRNLLNKDRHLLSCLLASNRLLARWPPPLRVLDVAHAGPDHGMCVYLCNCRLRDDGAFPLSRSRCGGGMASAGGRAQRLESRAGGGRRRTLLHREKLRAIYSLFLINAAPAPGHDRLARTPSPTPLPGPPAPRHAVVDPT